MNRWQIYLVLGIGIFGLGLGTGLGLGIHHSNRKAAMAQTQADQHEGAALSHAADATATHAQGEAQAATVATADQKVAEARKALVQIHPVVAPLPGIPEAVPVSGDALVIAKQDALILAQDQEISALKLRASIAQAEADQWHKAFDESQKALALQKIEAEAAASAERRRGWLRTFGGLAVGAAIGRSIK